MTMVDRMGADGDRQPEGGEPNRRPSPRPGCAAHGREKPRRSRKKSFRRSDPIGDLAGINEKNLERVQVTQCWPPFRAH